MSDVFPVDAEPRDGNESEIRLSGFVLRLLSNQGFGFIRGYDRITRWFHARDVEPRIDFDLLDEGQQVTFIPIDMGRDNPAMKKGNGLRATDVRRIA